MSTTTYLHINVAGRWTRVPMHDNDTVNDGRMVDIWCKEIETYSCCGRGFRSGMVDALAARSAATIDRDIDDDGAYAYASYDDIDAISNRLQSRQTQIQSVTK